VSMTFDPVGIQRVWRQSTQPNLKLWQRQIEFTAFKRNTFSTKIFFINRTNSFSFFP
jgi:hypothetical protein